MKFVTFSLRSRYRLWYGRDTGKSHIKRFLTSCSVTLPWLRSLALSQFFDDEACNPSALSDGSKGEWGELTFLKKTLNIKIEDTFLHPLNAGRPTFISLSWDVLLNLD